MSLYLKYRPQDFNSLVGQEFIKETLKESIKKDSTVGAYLFCGPRGTGKTSTARIMTKALNCINLDKGNPCNKCEICKSINNESLVDVIEIDAASHTGVDNIRNLIERAEFLPTNSKYKVYIIDEVHMLSKGAFNALLKTLEEPPKHVKFILATTETHKVPDTIISRCQRYDFKRITESDIQDRLKLIAKSEKVKIDSKSLDYIAKNSGGGLRNAISLFEQLINNSEVSFENIINTLGIISTERLEAFLNKLLNKNNLIINDFQELINSGKNIKLFLKELIFHTKEDIISEIKSKSDISNKLLILEELDNTYSKMKNSLDENTTFLVGILKITSNNTQKIEEKSNITVKKIEKEVEIKQEKTIEKKEEIKIEDVGDVFGEEEPSKNTENKSEFNIEALIKSLKDLGAKGGLTMSIRGAKININNSLLEIVFPTVFALKGVNTPDNITLIKQALEKIGKNNLELKLKLK